MDITPALPAGALVIRNYGPAGFTVADTLHPGAILLHPHGIGDLEAGLLDETGWRTESLGQFLDSLRDTGAELVLFGSGRQAQYLPESWKTALRAQGMASEGMDTGAACRTYNVLLGEGRRIAAILVPPAADAP